MTGQVCGLTPRCVYSKRWASTLWTSVWCRNGMVCMNQTVAQRWWRVLSRSTGCPAPEVAKVSWDCEDIGGAQSEWSWRGLVVGTAGQLSPTHVMDDQRSEGNWVSLQGQKVVRFQWDLASIYTSLFPPSTSQLRCKPGYTEWPRWTELQTETEIKFSSMYI